MDPSATLLHLDTPKATPVYGEFETRGWAVSHAPIRRVFVERPEETITFAFTERPDVRAAFPTHGHATGFAGSLTGNFIHEGRVTFKVETDAGVTEHSQELAPPFFPPAAPPPDFPVTTELKTKKIARLAGRMACTVCKRPMPAGKSACPRCGAQFQLSPTLLDFFTPEQRATIPAADATPASRGGIDEVMFSIIQQCADGLILDCGSGLKDRVYPNVINLEIMDYPCTDVRAFNESLPFADGTFDAVFTLAVLEHVRDPFAAGREIIRVLKPGGILYSMVPLMVPFHGYPNHFYNMTIEGHKNLYGTALELLDTSVPLSGRPIWGLSGVLTNWIAGLPPAHREEFLDLRVRDLLGSPLDHLKKNYVRYLSPEANMELAAMTRIIGRKR
ncbi:MAG TPA: class I SAM-dependent methyltransferase [Opitutaceae bacterium]|nr:class I SAM-dependent methyltransferase [Opitutaceae bacterium]